MKPRVLIVEDEPAIVDNIQYALETEGFATVCLASGEPVLAFLARDTVDLIILDIGLPDVSGMELCKEIRKSHSIPVIFLTARTVRESAGRAPPHPCPGSLRPGASRF